MSTNYYMEFPEEYRQLYVEYAHSSPKRTEIYSHTIALLIAGWSPEYILSHYSRGREIIRNYRDIDYTQFDFPIVPEPHIDSPHLVKLRSIHLGTAAGNSASARTAKIRPLSGLTQEQVKELYDMFQHYRSFRRFTPRDEYATSPKWEAYKPLAQRLLFYYSLGVPPSLLSQSMSGQPHRDPFLAIKLLKGYYQWPTPFLSRKSRDTFSLTYFPQISHMEQDLLQMLSPSRENVESLSQTPHCTPFGPDLTLQKHLFRRTSYLNLFKALPREDMILRRHQVNTSISPALPDVDADHSSEESTHSPTLPTTESTH